MSATILYVGATATLSNGAERVGKSLMTRLLKEGYHVHCVKPVTHQHDRYGEDLGSLGVTVHSVPYGWWTDGDESRSDVEIEAVHAIVEIIRISHASLVISNTLNVPWGAFAAAVSNVPHIWLAHEYPNEGEFSYLSRRLAMINALSSCLMTASEGLRDVMATQYGIEAISFRPPVDIPAISDSAIHDQRLVCVSGGYSDRKNQLELLKALAIIKGRDPAFSTQTLLIGGDARGLYSETLRTFISQHGLSDLVTFVDFTEDPWLLVRSTDVAVFPSKQEVFPIAVCEAILAGLPVIASDIRGHTEVADLSGGLVTGRIKLYRCGDASDLADNMVKTLDTNMPTNVMDASDNLRECVLQETALGPVVAAVESVLEKEGVIGSWSIPPYILTVTDTAQSRWQLLVGITQRLGIEAPTDQPDAVRVDAIISRIRELESHIQDQEREITELGKAYNSMLISRRWRTVTAVLSPLDWVRRSLFSRRSG
ncbi:MAG: glycosyltransferase family 4 protein [Propionibacteriaceae bacterium]|nr:glycosyltransferase family 4 protein [Propionibacteriaceae bacterium]